MGLNQDLPDTIQGRGFVVTKLDQLIDWVQDGAVTKWGPRRFDVAGYLWPGLLCY